MTEMVDRVERELDYPWKRRADRKRLARAAILALRDPDHDTTAAVVAYGDDRTEVVKMWNAMIDEILKE